MDNDFAHTNIQVYPWDDEPNMLIYQDTFTKLFCFINRSMISGHLCGYVAITKTEYEKLRTVCDFSNIKVHGGITYIGKLYLSTDETFSSNHIYIGFDCAHSGDYLPFIHDNSVGIDKYKNIHFVKVELCVLGVQILELLKLVDLEEDNTNSSSETITITSLN